jgi:hypothetical protein
MTIKHSLTYSRKLLSLILPAGLACAFAGGCVGTAEAQPTDQLTEQQGAAPDRVTSARAIATITNTLPADGCAYVTTINGVDYAPDPSSQAAAAELMAGSSMLRAVVDYRLTGQTGVVQCGFGFNQELPQVSFTVRRVIDSE